VPRAGPRNRIDLVGALLAAVGLGGPVYGLIEQEEFGWESPAVIVPLAIGTVGLAAFIWWEGRVADPMMPLALFRSRNFWVGNAATAAIYGALSLGLLVITLFLQQVVGFSATAAGAATVPTTVMVLFFSSLFGSLAGRHGSRWFMAVGPMISAAGFFWMLTAAEPANFWLQILPGIILFGFGLSITVAPLTAAVLGAVSSRQSGIASAVNNAVSRVAGLMTVAILGLIVGGTLDYPGFHRVVVVTATLFVLGGLVSAWGIRNPARESGDRLSS
jgi:predicted MFS family arabinose efflux permease